MRDYGIVSPRFWIGATGKELRKHPYAQRVALYLMSAPSSEMTGVYYCPVTSILFEVGSPFDAPSKGLQEQIDAVKEALSILSDLDFCLYDFESEYVFVKEMARWQIAESLKPSDKRVIAVRKAVASMPLAFQRAFVERYNVDFCLGFSADEIAKIASPIEAPSMPHRSQEQEQEQEQKHIKAAPKKSSPKNSVLNFYDVSESVVTDWKQLRKNKKAVISQSVIDDLKKKADQMRALGHYEWNLEAIMREQVVRNWQGFRPEWVLGKGEHAKELPQLELTPEAKARRRAEALRAQQSAQRMQEDEDPNGVFEDLVGQVWEEVKRAPD